MSKRSVRVLAATVLTASVFGCPDTPPGGSVTTAPAPPTRPAFAEPACLDPAGRTAHRAVVANLGELRTVVQDLTGYSAEGAELNAYLDGSVVRAASVTFYGETGQADENYYFSQDGELFLVLREESRYDEPFGSVAQTHKECFAFREGQLVRWTRGGEGPVSKTEGDYATRQADLLGLARTILETTSPRR